MRFDLIIYYQIKAKYWCLYIVNQMETDFVGFFSFVFVVMQQILFKFKYCLYLYIIGIFYLPKEYIGKKLGLFKSLQYSDLPRQDDKYCIITGGTSGIGAETAKTLSLLGMNVIIGSLSLENKHLKDLQKKYSNIKIEFWHLDLASMDSIKEFAKKFLNKNYPLHLLILNAGIMYGPYEITENGHEKQFAVNYLGHCLLIKLLFKKLQETGTEDKYARIVNISSCCHFAGKINFDDIRSSKVYSSYYCYAQSKVAQVMFTYSLQRYIYSQNSFITVNCVHPGVVHTNLYQYVFWINKWTAIFFKTPEEGAQTVLYAALSPDLEKIGGKYLEECTIKNSSVYSLSKEHQDHLWDFTWTFLKPWLNI